jgi:hypothetical protein
LAAGAKRASDVRRGRLGKIRSYMLEVMGVMCD